MRKESTEEQQEKWANVGSRRNDESGLNVTSGTGSLGGLDGDQRNLREAVREEAADRFGPGIKQESGPAGI